MGWIERQLRDSGIRDERILGAFASVPREEFVPNKGVRRFAYAPVPLPIGRGQTLSQPFIVARMLELAGVSAESTVLDVGAGSGYQTALLARLCRRVYGLELVPELAARANGLLQRLGIGNASVHVGSGVRGLPEFAPYDVILVAAAAREIPAALEEQLAPGGRLIIPVGPHLSKVAMAWRMVCKVPSPQRLHRIVRGSEGFAREVLDGVYFVPFVGD